MPLPTFVVIGAAKSGTTALYAYLGQHPEVYVPLNKEPSWFSFDGQVVDFTTPYGGLAPGTFGIVTDRSDYEALYIDASPGQARGDLSPVYLYWPGTAENVAALVPDMRIVALLRHPVDRAFSSFMHARREDREPIHDFRAALDAEPGRIADNCGLIWRYRDQGRYASQLERWQRVFPPDQFFLTTYDDFASDPVGTCRRIQSFIGVDSGFTPDTSLRHNVSGIPRSRLLYDSLGSHGAIGRSVRRIAPRPLFAGLKRSQTRLRTTLLRSESLSPEDRAALTQEWRSDIEQVGDVTDLDVTAWLRPRESPTGRQP